MLSGTGDDDGIQLCGAFPIPDISGDGAPTLENVICLLADEVVDEKTVRGIANGHFDGSYGESCELFDSPITLTK